MREVTRQAHREKLQQEQTQRSEGRSYSTRAMTVMARQDSHQEERVTSDWSNKQMYNS
jgi:hypothetical protein